MTEEIIDQTPAEKSGTAGDEKNTEVNYEEKFKASQSEAIKLRKEYDEYKKSHEKPQADKDGQPDDEKVFRERLENWEKEKAENAKKEDEQLKSDLDKLHQIHGDFDDKKLIKVVERYGVYDNDGNVNWSKAYELYERLGGQAEYQPKKKPEPKGNPEKKPEVDVSQNIGKKSMHEIVSESLKKFGL